MFRKKRLYIIAAALFLAAVYQSASFRLFLENSYIGAPFVIAFNRARPYLNTANNEECFAELSKRGLEFKKVENHTPADGCPIVQTAMVKKPLSSKRLMTCSLALAVDDYVTDYLKPLAVELLDDELLRIGDKGVRNCRTIAGRKFLLSEHAFSNALDISKFYLRKHGILRVENDWNAEDRRALFIKRAAQQACRRFNMTITPDTDELHKDHIHVDMGLARGCNFDQESVSALEGKLKVEAGTVLEKPSPNFSLRPEPVTINAIVLHATKEDSLEAVVEIFSRFDSKRSSHFTIDRDGTVVSHVPLRYKAWHAGESKMPDGRASVNDFSIGIELVNRNDGKDPYPEMQIKALRKLIVELKQDYPISSIVSHAEISVPAGRSDDPAGFNFELLEGI